MSVTKKENVDTLNPRTTKYEFFGPPGALAVTLGVPFLTYALYFGCKEGTGCPPPMDDVVNRFTTATSDLNWWLSLWDTKATLIYFGWYVYCVAAWAILPGDWIDGVTLRTGEKKKYKINAFSTFLLTLGAVIGYIYSNGPESFTFLYERWTGFITASLLMSVIQGLYCYISSFYGEKLLALGGNSGNFIYDVGILPFPLYKASLMFVPSVLHRPSVESFHWIL